jgi:hypothetical protein
MSSGGNGGGTEAGRISEGGTTAGVTRGSISTVSFSGGDGRSAAASPGARLNACNAASRLRNLISKSLTLRRAPVALAIATRVMTINTRKRRKRKASIN